MNTSIKTTPQERKLGFRVLFLGMFAIGTGQTLFIAVLPPYARGLGLSEVQVGFIFSLSCPLYTSYAADDSLRVDISSSLIITKNIFITHLRDVRIISSEL